MAGTFNKVHLVRQVDLLTLKLFLTVMEERQVGRAAARENLAASAATRRIQDLEEVMGVQLFERTPRGVTPTAAGQVLARHLTGVFGTFEDIRRDLEAFTEGVRGTIRVASTGSLISLYLAREIGEFAQGFPQVDIDLREAINSEVARLATTGEVDVGVFVMAPGAVTDDLDCMEYRTDRLIALVPRDHPLAERQHVKAAELLGQNLVALPPYASLMGQIRQAALEAGLEFKPKYTVNSVYAATSLVRAGQGVTIQPEHMVSRQDEEWVRSIALDEPWAQRRILLGTQRDRPRSTATRNFLAQLAARPAQGS
ncbi:MAG TPA: LysR family transcriptional regulator [Ramlibacter sp.]|nr:LysR family transcriptional regulator [Ramlibacter sp.]